MTESAAAEAVVLTEDYTDLRLAVSRQWTMGDLSLKAIGGAVFSAFIPAAVATVVLFMILLPVYIFFGVDPGWILLSVVPLCLGCYFFFAREHRSRLSALDSLRLRLLDRRNAADMAGSCEPTDYLWVLILWSPAERGRRR